MSAKRKIIRGKIKQQEKSNDISGFWTFYQLGLNETTGDEKDMIRILKEKIKHMKKTNGSKRTIATLQQYLMEYRDKK